MTFKAENCIVPKAPNLTRLKVSGELPDLRVNFSGTSISCRCTPAYRLADRKYKILMRLVDVAIPHFDGVEATNEPAKAKTAQPNPQAHRRRPSTFVQAPQYLSRRDDDYPVGVDSDDENAIEDDDNDEFVLAPDLIEGVSATHFPRTARAERVAERGLQAEDVQLCLYRQEARRQHL
jgi:vacuolar protein sorting-associated protein 13A/C